MRVLLVGEGKHELAGSLETLVRRLLPSDIECVTDRIARSDIHVHRGKGSGYEKKALRWMMEADRRGFDAIVLVIDEDDRAERCEEMDRAQGTSLVLIPRALGVAIRTFDAWMLADQKPWTKVTGKAIDQFPMPESLQRPKDDAERIASGFGKPLSDVYRAVAADLDFDVLAKRCPKGFAPFASRLVALRALLERCW